MLKTGKFHQFKINKPKLELETSANNTLQLPIMLSNRNLSRLHNNTDAHYKMDAESMNSTFLTNDDDFQSVSTCNNTNTNEDLYEMSIKIKKKQIIKNKKKSKRNYNTFIYY